MSRVVVIGGGFVGQMVQLLIPDARLLDNRPTAPEDHLETRQGPQYLWEPIPGVPSTSFEVITTVDGQPPTEQSIKAYKRKIGKLKDGGDWGKQFQYETRGFHSELPKPRVDYGQTVEMVDLVSKKLAVNGTIIDYDILINTVALPKFLEMLMIGPQTDIAFRNDPIYMTVFRGPSIPSNHYLHDQIRMDYISDANEPTYRQTTRHGDVYSEALSPSVGAKKLWPGKIHSHKDSERILLELMTNDCWCFGRYASWRPDELAHETWKEINDVVHIKL